jgi:hypothetical protein
MIFQDSNTWIHIQINGQRKEIFMYWCYIRFILILAHHCSVSLADECFRPGNGDIWHTDCVYVPVVSNSKCFYKRYK